MALLSVIEFHFLCNGSMRRHGLKKAEKLVFGGFSLFLLLPRDEINDKKVIGKVYSALTVKYVLS